MTRTGVVSPFPSGLRRLWTALTLSTLGDWLSILALTALAASLSGDSGYRSQAYAVGGVLVLKLMPAVLLGSVAGSLGEGFDRRLAMVVADVLRFALLLSVPLVGRLDWLLVATFLVGFLGLFWRPAWATVPEEGLPLLRWYGAAPVAALLFAVLALVAGGTFSAADRADLPLYGTAAVFLIAAAVAFLSSGQTEGALAPPLLKQLAQGRRAVGGAPMVRGLTLGMIGLVAACGALVSVARVYVEVLGGGDAGYGLVFGAVFAGAAFGLFLGLRILRGFSRRRLLGLAVAAAGLTLIPIALIQNLVAVVVLTLLLGGWAGVALAIGHSLAGREAPEQVRETVLGYLDSTARILLLPVLAAAALVAGLIGRHRFELTEQSAYHLDGVNVVLLLAAVAALLSGLLAYRRLDDQRGVPLAGDLMATLRGVPYTPPGAAEDAAATDLSRDRGLFVAFEGGEGAGKTTQARLAAIWLRDQGYEVVSTHEPGATKIGMRLRAIVLDKQTTGLSAWGEALLYAADRADHVANVIEPALRRGAVVVTDRYVDSSLAYQGYGRELPVGEVAEVNRWATGGLLPQLTVLLDVPPETGLGRFASPADRMESQPRDFHERVRDGFRRLAEADPDRYLVVDAGLPQAEITRLIQDRIRTILPDPVPAGTEDATSTFPAIRE